MIVTHQTLLPESEISNLVILRDSEGQPHQLAFSQGSILHIADINSNGYQISESYPFKHPILTIAPIEADEPTVFVLLRNYFWVIMRMPNFVKCGSFYTENACKARKDIMRRPSPVSMPFAASNPTATAAIRIAEASIACAVHPACVAVSIYQEGIHVLQLAEPYTVTPINVNINVIDMAFICPKSAIRLAYLSDSQSGGRELHILTLTSGKFVEDHCIPLPVDAHKILPLEYEDSSSLIVFTRDGIIRVTAMIGRNYTLEHLSAFLPRDGIILHHCHLGDDKYLLCDSSGGLSGGQFPIIGRTRTEFIRNVGPSCGIVVIDDERLVVATPFGDSIVYEYSIDARGFTMTEQGRINGTGPILSMEVIDDEFLLATGRGNCGAVRSFSKFIDTQLVAEIAVKQCLNLFCVWFKNTLYICMCFHGQIKILSYSHGEFQPIEIPGLNEKQTKLIEFCQVGDGCVCVTEEAAMWIDMENFVIDEKKTKHFRNTIVTASVGERNFVVVDQKGIIRVMKIDDWSVVKRWHINKLPLFVAINETEEDTLFAVYLLDSAIFLFEGMQAAQEIQVPMDVIPVSMAIDPATKNILLGTRDGLIVTIEHDSHQITRKSVAKDKVVLRSANGSVISSGTPPFIYNGSCEYITAHDCQGIASVNDYICCIERDCVAIYQKSGKSRYATNYIMETPGLVNLYVDQNDKNKCICIVEDPMCNQSLILYNHGNEAKKYEQPKARKISLFKVITLGTKKVIVVGDSSNTVTIFDENLNIMATQKTLGLPTAVCDLPPNHIAIARPGSIDFYEVDVIDDCIEMECKAVVMMNSTACDLISVSGFVIASDQHKALEVFVLDRDGASAVGRDNKPHQLRKLAALGNTIFASSFSSAVYCYELASDGTLNEIGSFMCDSDVLSFATKGSRLFYGTVKGGIGVFDITNNPDLLRLQSVLYQEDQTDLLLDERVPPSLVEYPCDNIFVDLDNLSVIESMEDKDIKRICKKAQLRKSDLPTLLHH